MNTRVKSIRKSLKMSQEAFGNRLGVTGAGISKIESGDRKLTEQMLLMICKEFNINENWLRYGEGEIYKQKLPLGLDQLVECYHLDELDKRIIYEYTSLDEKKRRVIKDYIMRIAYGNTDTNVIADGEVEQKVMKCAETPDSGFNNADTSYNDCLQNR